MSHQIDGDVDFEVEQELCGLSIRQRPHIVEGVTGRGDAPGQLAVFLRPKRNTDDLEVIAVVRFQDRGHQPAHRMVAKIPRQIGNAQARMRAMLAGPERRWRTGDLIGGELAGAALLRVRIGRIGQRRQGRDDRALIGDARGHSGGVTGATRPVAKPGDAVGRAAERQRVIRRRGQRRLKARQRLLIAGPHMQHVAAIGQGVSMCG